MLSSNKPNVKNASYSMAGAAAWISVVFISYVLLLLILAGPFFFGHHVKAGDIAEQNVTANRKVMVPDEEKTEDARELVRRGMLPILRRDVRKSDALLNKIVASFERLRTYYESNYVAPKTGKPAANTVPGKVVSGSKVETGAGTNLPQSPPLLVPEAGENSEGSSQRLGEAELRLRKLLIGLKPAELNAYFSDSVASVKRMLSHMSLQPYVEKHEWEDEIFEFLPENMKSDLRRATATFVSQQLEPNVSVDIEKTRIKLDRALDGVQPVMKEIDSGAVIVKQGDRISEQQVTALQSLGINELRDPSRALMIAISLFAAFVLFGIYLFTYEAQLFFAPSAIALMATISIATCATAFFVGHDYPQFVPLSAATLVLGVTYGRRVAGILTVLILLFFSAGELIDGTHLMALGAAAGMALGASIKRRKDLMLTGFLFGMMQMLGYFTAVVLSGADTKPTSLGIELAMQMMGGLFAAIAAIGALPFLENIFGILTPYRIAELSEPDQPLMRQLEENAPGTYQHSLAVANLAEGGARAIGADVNLVHTGAMYHDIGKMVTPRYFIENQLGDKNPHDYIPPEESKAKVLAHVTNGIALAQKYGLPKAIQAFIPEHQGTTIMAYFYHKACVRDGVENVDQEDYRYPGPKPQTKESAIVMLADVSEAVTHSMKDPSMEEVDAVMSNVFKARWDDGQFSDCNLTLDELERVRKGFVRVWRTLHHDRLKYPSTTTGKMPVIPDQKNSTNTLASDANSGVLSPSDSASSSAVALQDNPEHKDKNGRPLNTDSATVHKEASEWDC